MRKRTVISTILATTLAVTMSVTATAAQNPFSHMETQSKQAVETAIKAGTVPHGTTIYDCMYGADKNGVTVVIQYKDKNGNWIDVTTQKKKDYLPGTFVEKLSDETLAEYADEMFRLTNAEREKAGLDPLERDSLLDEAAMIRAPEVSIVDKAGGKPHTRPDGTSFTSVLDDIGIDGNRCGENIARVENTPQAAIDAWLRSDGHRKNILYEDYGSIGIGVCQLPNGALYWIQIFELK